MGPEDPRQMMNSVVDANGGWGNWSGGFISGVGYVGSTTTITASSGSSGNGIMGGLQTAFTSMANAYGLTSSHIDAVTTFVDENKLITFSFKLEGGFVKLMGKTAGGVDVFVNVFELHDDEAGSWQMWEDIGQIALGVLCIGTGGIGGLVLGAGLAAWELYEAYGEYDN